MAVDATKERHMLNSQWTRDDGRRPTQSRSKLPQIALVVIVVANPLMLLSRRGRRRCAPHAIHRN
jgi:hypothetical protein